MDDLYQLHKEEDEIYKTLTARHKDEIDIANEFYSLYKLMAEIISQADASDKISISVSNVTTICFGRCMHRLISCFLAAMRGHKFDSMRDTRQALEYCAIASRVFHTPHLAEIWEKAEDSDNDYRNFTDKFRVKDLFPETSSLLRPLYARYEICSRQSHGNVFSIINQIEATSEKDQINFEFNFFDHLPGKQKPAELTSILLWSIDAHRLILDVYEKDVFKDVIRYDRTRWKKERKKAIERLKEQCMKECQSPSPPKRPMKMWKIE